MSTALGTCPPLTRRPAASSWAVGKYTLSSSSSLLLLLFQISVFDKYFWLGLGRYQGHYNYGGIQRYSAGNTGAVGFPVASEVVMGEENRKEQRVYLQLCEWHAVEASLSRDSPPPQSVRTVPYILPLHAPQPPQR